MPRAIRSLLTGEMHHVTARGVVRRPIFRDTADRRRYLRTLGRQGERVGWRCLSYCLMNNHVHLLLEGAQPDLSRGMQQLQGQYAQWFNRRHKQSGHLFQGRFHAEPVANDDHFWSTIAYVVNNPVNAGLCASAEEWPWSSHNAVLLGEALPWLDTRRLFAYIGDGGGDPRRIYRDFLNGVRPRLGA